MAQPGLRLDILAIIAATATAVAAAAAQGYAASSQALAAHEAEVEELPGREPTRSSSARSGQWLGGGGVALRRGSRNGRGHGRDDGWYV